MTTVHGSIINLRKLTENITQLQFKLSRVAPDTPRHRQLTALLIQKIHEKESLKLLLKFTLPTYHYQQNVGSGFESEPNSILEL